MTKEKRFKWKEAFKAAQDTITKQQEQIELLEELVKRLQNRLLGGKA